MDFRIVLKYFPFGESRHLDVVAELFNLFNHPNVLQINPVFGSNLAPMPYLIRPPDRGTWRATAVSSRWISSSRMPNRVHRGYCFPMIDFPAGITSRTRSRGFLRIV